MNNDFNLEEKEKTIGAKLSCYASGSGALSFVYDRCGKATGENVTMRDVKWYVKNRAPHLSEWFVGRVSSQAGIILFTPVSRKAPDELSVRGRSYRYERAGHVLLVTDPDDGHEVKNINTLAVIRFYLDHEQELDALIYRGGL